MSRLILWWQRASAIDMTISVSWSWTCSTGQNVTRFWHPVNLDKSSDLNLQDYDLSNCTPEKWPFKMALTTTPSFFLTSHVGIPLWCDWERERYDCCGLITSKRFMLFSQNAQMRYKDISVLDGMIWKNREVSHELLNDCLLVEVCFWKPTTEK